MSSAEFKNPYRPGAGHMPPHLAGREAEYAEFDRLLGQETILDNMVLTGLRGVGKTVLLETFKPRAMAEGWLWAGTDLSEAVSVSEENLAIRLMADLSVITTSLVTVDNPGQTVGFAGGQGNRVPLSYDVLVSVYTTTPGLVADRLKAVLEFAWHHLQPQPLHRVIFAYDEAQNLSDNAAKNQYPLSVLLDVFQSIQKKNIPFMLVLTGLPTLFPKLVEARTFAERMFRVMFLDRLNCQWALQNQPLMGASKPARVYLFSPHAFVPSVSMSELTYDTAVVATLIGLRRPACLPSSQGFPEPSLCCIPLLTGFLNSFLPLRRADGRIGWF